MHYNLVNECNHPVNNQFQAALRELCLAHKDNLPTLLKHTIFNELSNARNPNNMSMLHVMFTCDPVSLDEEDLYLLRRVIMGRNHRYRCIRLKRASPLRDVKMTQQGLLHGLL